MVFVTFFIRVGFVVLIVLILGVVERLRLSFNSERVDFPARPGGTIGLPFGKGLIFNSLVTSGWNTIRVADPFPLGGTHGVSGSGENRLRSQLHIPSSRGT